ncbi:mitochondrial ribosomal protein S29 precursor, putative [Plasmodium ovale wallikeri]|uniref:Small ribosomal subunit protein mS29 n=1 Tax=Plasmodium ovale wallikeri TaxID=864142 RepID=A0A1A8ZIV6_PLAOA|nr:mitochondrial ribosomal protein S29 precursor, putative [Plasmodium ovale wallikeri]SBT43801.1 mitochondrial ribosomal protein S29 precursor, putative [Plasmodium ovale wallikeri]
MKVLPPHFRKYSTYKIPPIINNTKVHRTYKEGGNKNEDDFLKIYNKDLVAYPYDEDRYNELLNIKDKKEKRNVADFFFNLYTYINVQNDKIKNIKLSHFDIKNTDKCFIFEKEYLDNYFPEGLAGELPKDMIMHHHNNDYDNFDVFLNEIKKYNNQYGKIESRNFQNVKGIGVLYRKITYEIINELKHCSETYRWRKHRESYNLDNYFLKKRSDAPYYDNGFVEKDSRMVNQERCNVLPEEVSVGGNGGEGYSFYSPTTSNECRRSAYQSRGILLDGKRGTGKSCVLNSVVLWAKLSGWLVIFIPDIKKYKFDINTIVRSNTNLYIQPDLSRQFLENIVKVNDKLLKEIKIKKDILKNTCLDGTHLLYNKRIYDDIIKKTVDAEIIADKNYDTLNEKEKNMYRQKLYKFYYDNIKIPNILDKFSIPPNLLELANIGINNSAYANLCVYALFEHLKKQTQFPLLIAIDQFNYNLSVSEYLSINFENTKYNGYIPTYYFTIPKLLLQWNISTYKRCVKIVSTCWDRENRRNFRPELLGIHKKEIKTVRNFTLREFKNYVSHLYNQNVIYNFDINKLEYFYMLTGMLTSPLQWRGEGKRARLPLRLLLRPRLLLHAQESSSPRCTDPKLNQQWRSTITKG